MKYVFKSSHEQRLALKIRPGDEWELSSQRKSKKCDADVQSAAGLQADFCEWKDLQCKSVCVCLSSHVHEWESCSSSASAAGVNRSVHKPLCIVRNVCEWRNTTTSVCFCVSACRGHCVWVCVQECQWVCMWRSKRRLFAGMENAKISRCCWTIHLQPSAELKVPPSSCVCI